MKAKETYTISEDLFNVFLGKVIKLEEESQYVDFKTNKGVDMVLMTKYKDQEDEAFVSLETEFGKNIGGFLTSNRCTRRIEFIDSITLYFKAL